jgi:ferredoxin
MDSSICYFTGTGNSLAVARELASRLQTGLLAMKDAAGADREEIESGDCLGMVFPVYNHRIPYIVKRFTDKLRNIDGKYIFAVCTYGDSPCIALEYLSDLLLVKGGRLSCGFGLKMPYNYINPSKGFTGIFKPFVLREVPEDEQRRMFLEAEQKLGKICEAVRSKREGYMEAEHQRLEHAVDFLNLRESLQKRVWLKISGYKGKTDLPYMESIQLMDCGFYCDDRCVRCGTCVKICPIGNIKMTEEGPKWQGRCEQCFACLHWCPKSALQFGSGTAGRRRYHHPGVTLADMLTGQNPG